MCVGMWVCGQVSGQPLYWLVVMPAYLCTLMGVTFTSHAAVAIHSFALKQPHVQSTVQRKTLGLCFSHKYLDTFADKYTCMRCFFKFYLLRLEDWICRIRVRVSIMYFKLVAAEGGHWCQDFHLQSKQSVKKKRYLDMNMQNRLAINLIFSTGSVLLSVLLVAMPIRLEQAFTACR